MLQRHKNAAALIRNAEKRLKDAVKKRDKLKRELAKAQIAVSLAEAQVRAGQQMLEK